MPKEQKECPVPEPKRREFTEAERNLLCVKGNRPDKEEKLEVFVILNWSHFLIRTKAIKLGWREKRRQRIVYLFKEFFCERE